MRIANEQSTYPHDVQSKQVSGLLRPFGCADLAVSHQIPTSSLNNIWNGAATKAEGDFSGNGCKPQQRCNSKSATMDTGDGGSLTAAIGTDS